ncbi:apolipoprotein D-like [Maniola hyperantus]|uniref:apolipoprotein D-like n=1 Tax=Aphantopus hyperantus TaxID=2795564 RepID=UPI001568BE7C|nr:apolipoprotein D-like [Maniola hyperantus]
MSKHYVFVAVVLSFHVLCRGQEIFFGDCEDVKTMEYFEIEKFLGKWYTIQHIPSWYEQYGQCTYKLVQQCGRTIEIQHRSIQKGVEYVLHMNTTYAPGDEAVLVIPKNNIDPVGIPLSILWTDYTNYAVVYGCKHNQLINIKYVLAWILSRNTTLPPETLDSAYKELKVIPGLSLSYLETVNHSEELCSYHWTAHVQAIYNNDTQTDRNTLFSYK